MIKRMLSFALVGLAVSTAASAQGHQQQMQDQRQGVHAMMGDCAWGGVPGPAALLEAGTELALTDAQVEQLKALDNKVAGTRAPHMRQAMELHQKAAQILNSDNPDFEEYKTVLEQMHTAMVPFHVENAKLAVEARGLLQPDQRSKLDELIKAGQGRLAACMQGKHEPMK
jgi:Spy/CpxP family protein refolding chaperone